MEMNLSQLQEIVKDREDWHAQAHGVMSDSDWTTAGKLSVFFFSLKLDSYWKTSVQISVLLKCLKGLNFPPTSRKIQWPQLLPKFHSAAPNSFLVLVS